MLKHFARAVILCGCLSFASTATTAQQVVHALVGTVKTINSVAKTISIVTDDGNEVIYKDSTDSKPPTGMDKALLAGSTPVGSFTTKGDSAIVIYYGGGDDRTVVALRNIGQGPFTNTFGTVFKFGGRDRSLLIKDNSGDLQTFKVAPDAVVETGVGAVDGKKFDPTKGDELHVMSSVVNGNPTVFFVYAN